MTDRREKRPTVKQMIAIQSLMTGATVQEAASKAGIARTTMYDWLNEPVFIKALEQAQREMMTNLTRSLAAVGAQAVKVLSDLLENTQTPPAVRMKAANVILSNLLRLYELYNLEERVNRLEDELNHNHWEVS